MKARAMLNFVLVAIIVAVLFLYLKKSEKSAEKSNPEGGNIEIVSSRPEAFVLLEAEDAEKFEPPVSVVEKISGASKGKCCYLGPEKVNENPEIRKYTKGYAEAAYPGYAKLRFEVPVTANYAVWVRVRWSDDCGDSLDVAIDNKFLGTIQGNAGRSEPHWIWLKVGTARFALSRRLQRGSTYTIALCNREDDLYFDQVLLIDARVEYEPVGIITKNK